MSHCVPVVLLKNLKQLILLCMKNENKLIIEEMYYGYHTY